MLMEKFHAASNGIIWKLIMVLIGVSFVLSGVAGYMFTQVDTSAAKVNGVEIPQQMFLQQYNNEYQALSQQFGAQFAAVADSPEFINGLRKNILNRLIDQELLRQYSEDLKLGISDTQIKQEIVSMPSLQTDGKFNNNLYQQMLAVNGISSDSYAALVREALRLEQLQAGLVSSDFIVPIQAEALAKLFFQRREVRLATFPLADEITKQTVSEQEMQTYYKENQSAFAAPELVKVQYIDLTRTLAEKNLNVTDVEISQYYQDNKAQYMSQRLAHIQVPTEQEAQTLYADLQKGESFTQLAKLYSTDKISAANGGDLDWVTPGMMPPKFEAAASKLDVGQYSQPVKVDNAYHIIKLEDEKVRSLDEVKNEIAAKIRNELAVNAFYALEKQVNEKAFENPDSLENAAKAVGVNMQETAYFSRQNIPTELNYTNVVSTIFDSDITQGGTNSEAINVGDQHSIVVRVVDHKPEGIRSFEDAKADIENYLKRQKAEALVLEKVQKLAQELSSATMQDNAVDFSEPQSLVYAENKDPILNSAVFAMAKPTDNKATYGVARDGNGDIVIVALQKVEDGKLSAEQLAAFNMQLQQARQAALHNTVLAALRNKAKVEINEEFMKQE
ncbi:peptidylprolyl isomerase [Actinobacillus seminis]|uniref:Periplasmic chaperone PpiD n=1 Tax=Actinobacillus seminis TaxID=722 RepID=A0A263HDH7_9PAST|nr:peptidylprolyl isomerase [Actinobacillus seminis]OZN24727.1 peptidylprolyl isomerase [Actinobacillus seminis]SUU35066.1 PpiC-type peptidyl-prolyl cis-trans isomerase [Actinobacillus seminis]